MVKASSAPAIQLTRMPSVITEKNASVMPNASASGRVMRPRGIGRLAVRDIMASMSPSYAMLSAPEAPAPTAMQSSEVNASTGWKWPGRDRQADQRGEDHQRHHPRLQQRDVIADLRLGDPRAIDVDGVVVERRTLV